MRRIFGGLVLLLLTALALPAGAASGRVIKVLPMFLDLKGRHSLSPSLYERDAYQYELRRHPEKQSGMTFDVHWKAKGRADEPLKLRVELRGVLEDKAPKEMVMEAAAGGQRWLGNWTEIQLTGQKYRDFGEVTAWRVTLWEGNKLLGEQRSFLW